MFAAPNGRIFVYDKREQVERSQSTKDILGDVVGYVELLLVRSSKWRMLKTLTPIRKNNRGICGFGHHMTGVTGILIVGLQLN